MKYFLDTEFIENGSTIDLISVGIVAEDGRELYLGNRNCDFNAADDWVKKNVLEPLGVEFKGPDRNIPVAPIDPKFWKAKAIIKSDVAEFLGAKILADANSSVSWYLPAEAPQPEIWADYGSYDWVALCQLFGKMIDLPQGFPMYINDIQQEAKRVGCPVDALPKQADGFHNALTDAHNTMARHKFLKG